MTIAAAEGTSGQEFYKTLLDNLADGVYFLDCRHRITYWNRGAERLTGFGPQEVIGHSCSDDILMHVDENGKPLCGQQCPAAQSLSDGQSRQIIAYLHHKEGHRVPVLVRLAPIRDDAGRVIGVVELFNDDSAAPLALEKVQELQHLVLLDPLTGLTNRRHLEMSLQARLQETRRLATPFGIILTDIDKLKRVNDLHGYRAGDRVIQMVARTISKSSRSFDVVGRWDGGRFLVVMNLKKNGDLYTISERVRTLVEQSFIVLDSAVVGATISVGATAADARDALELILDRADMLAFRSKAAGGNRVTV